MTNEIFQLIIKSETAHIIESESFFKDNLCYIYDINNLKFNDFINTKGGFITTIFDFINNDINIKTINYKIILTTCSNMPYNIQIECKLDNNRFYNCGIFEKVEFIINFNKLPFQGYDLLTGFQDLVIKKYLNQYRSTITNYINNYFKNNNNKLSVSHIQNVDIEESNFKNQDYLRHIDFKYSNDGRNFNIYLNNNLYTKYNMLSYYIEEV